MLPNATQIAGQFDFGNETLTIAERSIVNFESPGGSLTVGNIVLEPDATLQNEFNWIAGRIILTDSQFRIGNDGQFRNSVELDSFRRISAPSTVIRAGATLAISGGYLETSTLVNQGGSFNYNSGILVVSEGDLNIGGGGITNPDGINIGSSGQVSAGGLLTIDAGRTANLTGGRLVVREIAGSGAINFESGVLNVLDGDITAGASGQLNRFSDILLEAGSDIAVGGQFNFQSGRNLLVDGGRMFAERLVSNGTITIENGYVATHEMERNHLVINGGVMQVTVGESSYNGSLVSSSTSDSSMTLNGGVLIATTARIGGAVGFVDTVNVNGGELYTGNLIANTGARSVLNFNGGTIFAENSDIDGPSAFTIGNGVTDALFIMGGGTHRFADGMELSASGRIAGEGAIVGDIFNHGRISPGNSPGTLSVDGNLLNFGVIDLEIESLMAYDSIIATGTFQAGGTISLSLLGYEPNELERFDLVDFGTFFDAGHVFDFSNAALPPGLAWDTSQFSIDGSIGVRAVPEPGALGLSLCGLIILFLQRTTNRRAANSNQVAL